MEAVYIALFILFAVPAALLEYSDNACFGLLSGGRAGGQQHKQEYLRFRNNYVVIFSLMMAGDWLQGPYVYHLYEHYGFSVRDIGRLFIMGFGSSAVFGTLAGSMADSRGRKRAALLYVATYSLSCLTKHSSDYWVLMLGRLLGGIATSLLFSAFESWAVAAHNAAGFDESLLGDLFTKAVFLGNGVMAIASGLLGNVLVEDLSLGPVAPFDAAIVVLLLGGVAIQLTWAENYGSKGTIMTEMLGGQFGQAIHTIRTDARVALLGASQALFEASMYTFVFLWTPALSPAGEKLPHGFVFAIFMTASMVGTALAGRLLRSVPLESLMQAVFWCSAAALFVPVVFHLDIPGAAPVEKMLTLADRFTQEANAVPPSYIGSQTSSSSLPRHLHMQDSSSLLAQASSPLAAAAADAAAYASAAVNSTDSEAAAAAADAAATAAAAAVASILSEAGAVESKGLQAAGVVQLVAFCVFEVLIGMFWPSMMTLRAKYVPEQQRSTIINVFRIPLNLFVCLILWKVSDFPLGIIFAVCSIFLATAAGCQCQLHKLNTTGYVPAHTLCGGTNKHQQRHYCEKRNSDAITTQPHYRVVSLSGSPCVSPDSGSSMC